MSRANKQCGDVENAVNKQVQIHRDQLAKSCREYRESIKLTLTFLNEKLNKTLGENMEGLAMLCDELGLYAKRIENQSAASLRNTPIKKSNKIKQLKSSSSLLKEEIREFDSIKLNIKDSTRMIIDKLDQIEKVHNQLMRAVLQDESSSSSSAITDDELEEERLYRMKSSGPIEPITEVSEDGDENDDDRNEKENKNEKENASSDSMKADQSAGNVTLDSSKSVYTSFVRIVQEQAPVPEENTNKDLVDLSPEVRRRKAFEDIHRRLVQQLEATDSLEGFLRLMERKPKTLLNPIEAVPVKLQPSREVTPTVQPASTTTSRSPRSTPTHSISGDQPPIKRRRKVSRLPAKSSATTATTTTTSAKSGDANLVKKYAGSLWFFHETQKSGGAGVGGVAGSKTRSKITAMKPRTTTMPAFQATPIVRSTTTTTTPMVAKKSSIAGSGSNTGGGTNLLVHTPEYSTQTNEEKCRRSKQALYRTRLKYYDLLDDVVCKDVQPLRSEYPRRDNIEEPKIIEPRRPLDDKVAKTPLLLNRIVEEDDNVLKNLVEPPSLKSTFSKVAGPTVQQSISLAQQQPQHQGQIQKKKKSKHVSNLMAYLTNPKHQSFYSMQPKKQDMVVMPVKVMYDNFPTKESTMKLIGGQACQQEAADTLAMLRRREYKPKTTNYTAYELASIIQHSGGDGQNLDTVNKFKLNEADQKSPEKETEIGTLPSTGVTAVVASRKKAMLDQLHNLKTKNDNIQKNIQKAIDVVETKMIDILSTDSPNNGDAFNAMENEITKVLNLMKDEHGKPSGEGHQQVEKVEAEKDENSGRLGANRGKMPMVSPRRKPEGMRYAGILDHFVPGSDLGVVPQPAKTRSRSPSPQKNSISHHPKEFSSPRPLVSSTTPTKVSHYTEPHKMKEPSPRNQYNKKISHISPVAHVRSPSPKAKKPSSPNHSNRISAPIQFEKVIVQKTPSNMEDSDKLFGQVDNVIKKIDNIYHKFSEKSAPYKKPSSYNNVMEFFDNIKAIDIQAWTELQPCRRKAHMAFVHPVVRIYEQAFTFYEKTFKQIPNEKGDFLGSAITGNNEELTPPATAKWINARQTALHGNSQPNLSESEIVLSRHIFVLQTFYAIFFSTIFVALNFDYTC